MTKLEMVIHQVSELREFYVKIKKGKRRNRTAGTPGKPNPELAARRQGEGREGS
jgi:hypothetical protein